MFFLRLHASKPSRSRPPPFNTLHLTDRSWFDTTVDTSTDARGNDSHVETGAAECLPCDPLAFRTKTLIPDEP
jgi:hypothetical protein